MPKRRKNKKQLYGMLKHPPDHLRRVFYICLYVAAAVYIKLSVFF